MKLTLVRHLWGVDHSHGLDHYLPRWRDAGYTAVETAVGISPNRDALFSLLKHSGMKLVPQVFSNDFTPGGNVREHIESLRRQIDEVLALDPLFFNAHSGADSWSSAEAEDFYGEMLAMEKSLGIPICHETHRMRYFATPWNTAPILKLYPELKLTCDFSHWVCVAERLLPDCDEIIRLAAEHCYHLHARVGHEEGPQVSDPRAPEWAGHLAAHESWWDIIWDSQRRRGLETSFLTPEFGPPPYLATLPHTGVPVADLADICDWMAHREAARCARFCS
ncbi:MAG: sugar phosphate isomerase/epimerase [Verrucomicrobiaceae bacterium]|nr:MAG: sugar phosphate isomerase/epimerase [Verrucomicrobiaceae bacterium]